MPLSDETLAKYTAQIRRIEASREKNAEKNIRRLFKRLVKDLQVFLSTEYVKYAVDDALSYDTLYAKGRYARFLDEIVEHIDTFAPMLIDDVRKLVTDTYKNCYVGMVEAVEKTKNLDELKTSFQAVKAVRPEAIKKAVENPISGLTLSDTLEKHRKDIIYNIKQQIGIGLSNGDRYTTMAKRISESCDMSYKKAIRIARTEGRRAREAGLNDSAVEIDNVIRQGSSGLIGIKIWHTMEDERVRPQVAPYQRKTGVKARKKHIAGPRSMLGAANHVKMNGQVVLIDEKFDLGMYKGRHVTASAPLQSGVAAHDINCRCFSEKDWVTEEEYKALTGKEPPNFGVDNSEKSGIIKVDKESLERYIGKPISETDNQHIREWYYANVSDIPNQIDKSLSFEEQVHQAFDLRNKYKHEARIAMSDVETAQMLENERPAPTFDDLLKNKMKRKNMTREEALKDILETASKTNSDVNKEFGL